MAGQHMPIGAEELAAYFNAAIAVTAFHVELPVRRISVELYCGRRGRPQLAPLNEYVHSRRFQRNPDKSTCDYVTALLSGAVGRVIGLESYLGYSEPHPELRRLRQAYLKEALLCRERETDKAYAIIVAFLDPRNDDDAVTTFVKFWHRADKLLRSKPHCDRLARLVEELKTKRVIGEEEIRKLLRISG